MKYLKHVRENGGSILKFGYAFAKAVCYILHVQDCYADVWEISAGFFSLGSFAFSLSKVKSIQFYWTVILVIYNIYMLWLDWNQSLIQIQSKFTA